MTSTTLEREDIYQHDCHFYSKQTDKLVDLYQPQFERMIKNYLWFNLFFLGLGILELSLCLLFLATIVQSLFFAFCISGLFLTFFSYLILRLYLKGKREYQFRSLVAKFEKACCKLLSFKEEEADHHLLLANAFCLFATQLQNREHSLYVLPRWLGFFNATLRRLSYWMHASDVHTMREMLLEKYVQEHLKMVKLEPSNLEVHTALANAYVLLSSLYVSPKQQDESDEGGTFFWEDHSEHFQKKFRETAQKAMEEFKILSHYAPNDPWVHEQLAYSYRDLQMPEEEIRAYETILHLCPHDRETMFKLGVLYFQNGHNAQGLRMYEELKRSHYKKAERLIHYYGSSVK